MIRRALLVSVPVVLVALALLGWLASRRQTPIPPLETCTDAEQAAALGALPPYEPASTDGFVRIHDGQFVADDQPIAVRGFNYYPSQYPWRRFLTETDVDTLDAEFALMESVGANTLRIFVWNEALFQCPGSGAVPIAEAFERLDRFIHVAGERNLRLIVTLNDLADLEAYPLYADPDHVRAQTAFVVDRYRGEATILAWDVRNEGDIDYGSNQTIRLNVFPREQVLGWLALTTERVRALDPDHLITAGWYLDAEATAPYVDFVSFHHWHDAADLLQRIAAMRAATDKPLLLEEVGYSTQRMNDDDQARTLTEIIAVSEREGLLGWLIWTAFDFPIDRTCTPSPCLSPDNAEHYFGVWRADYSAKPAVEVISQAP